MSNFHANLFQNSLYWCLDLIRHNIGTQLKLNKYIFDISIPFCHHLYLSATLKQCFTGICNILNHSPSCLHVSTRSISYVRFDWSFIFRVRIAKNVLICKPDSKNNRYKIWFNIFRSQKSYFSFFIHLLQNYLQINILCNPDPKNKRPIKSHV